MAQSNKPQPERKPIGIGEMLRRADVGTYLFLQAKDSTISAYAASAGVKVKTERLLAIHPQTKEVVDLTRVYIDSRKGEETPAHTPAHTPPHAGRRQRTSVAPAAPAPASATAQRSTPVNLRARPIRR